MNVNARWGGKENSQKNNAPGLSQRQSGRNNKKLKKNTFPGAISKVFEIAKLLLWGGGRAHGPGRDQRGLW